MTEAEDVTRRFDIPRLKALDVFQNFPGFGNAPAFLMRQIVRSSFKDIVDLGGGANPMLDEHFVSEHDIRYNLLDISEDELNKSPSFPRKHCIDICADLDLFSTIVPPGSMDLVFSHMFLEHLKEPEPAHINILSALRPGGIAIHFYPSPNNLPLTLNRLLPAWLSQTLLLIAQPDRTREGKKAKFPAYYKHCGLTTNALRRIYNDLGFELVSHTGYVGHGYYSRFPVIRNIEYMLRHPLVNLGLRSTSVELLVLRKPQ